MQKTLTAVAAAAVLVVSGCGTDTGEAGSAATDTGTGTAAATTTTATDTATSTAESTSTSDGDAGFLGALGLDGAGVKEVVDALEKTDADREAGIVGSIRYDHIVFNTPVGEQTMEIPEDEFYVSIAPFVEKTHECYYHNLATCQGELVEEDLDVTITSDDGEVLVDDTVTTYQNGFVGFWLPRDIEGTIEVSYDGKSVTAPLATGPEDPTCVTTLQLT